MYLLIICVFPLPVNISEESLAKLLCGIALAFILFGHVACEELKLTLALHVSSVP